MKSFRLVSAGLVFLCFCALLLAQAPSKLAFEVASVKPSPPLSTIAAQAQSGKLNIRMTIDGSRLELSFISLANMVCMAYKVKPHQISGPDWMSSQLFEIRAKLPEGSNREQIPEMMQTLLAERFKLVFHRETKEQPVYALIVGKNGTTLKESVEEAEAPASASDPAKASAAKEANGKQGSINTPDGGMEIKQEGRGMVMDDGKNGKMRMTMGEKGSMRMEFSKMKMSDFADLLSQFTDRQVVDMTDLKGSYEVALDIPMQDLLNLAKKMMPEVGALVGGATAPGATPSGTGLAGIGASDPSGGSMLDAVQKLGLKLDPRKMPTEKLIIENIEKTPTED
jgi:uncharacterized protein (TIGR03435 family)